MKTILSIATLSILAAFTFPQGIGAEMKSSSSPVAKSSRKAKTPTKSSKSSRSTNSTKAKPAAKSRKVESDGETQIKEARVAASKLTTAQKSKLLSLLNEGSDKQLIEIKGIAKTRSQSIIAARPFKSVEEIIIVKGIGASTYTKLLAHGKGLTSRKSGSKS